MPDRFDVVVVGAGPAGSAAALVLARAGARRRAARARAVPRLEEHVRRGRLRPRPRHAHPALVGGGAGPALGHAPRRRWCSPARRRSPSTSARRRGASRPTTAAPPTGPTSTPGWPARPTRPGRSARRSTTVDRAAARRRRARRRRAHRPARRRHRRAASSSPATASTRFLAKEAGLYPHADPSTSRSASKEMLALPQEVIDERFGVRGDDGVDIEIIGCTGRRRRRRLRLHEPRHASPSASCSRCRRWPRRSGGPRRSSPTSRRHPPIAPLVEGGELKEYSAHLIPEGGYDTMPELGARRHARGRRRRRAVPRRRHLAGGRQLRHRLGHGRRPRPPIDALRAGDTSAARPRRLPRAGSRRSFVLQDHRKLRRAPHLVLSDRVQHRYPAARVRRRRADVHASTTPRPKRGVLTHRCARRWQVAPACGCATSAKDAVNAASRTYG